MAQIQNPWANRPAGFWRGAQAGHGHDPSPASPLGSLVWAPAALSRNGVRYLRCRSWRSETRTDDMLSLKRLKLELRADTIDNIAADLADLALTIYGAGFFASVVPVACGHSRRTNCLSACLSVALAGRIGAAVVRAFADRFVDGVSHPKEFARLPPLDVVAEPVGPVLIVDDVATSGFHMHEAVTVLRQRGIATTGMVWVSGTKQG